MWIMLFRHIFYNLEIIECFFNAYFSGISWDYKYYIEVR